MGAPGGGRPGADWTAAYILIGVGVPVGWAIAVAVAVISERRAARRPVDPRVAATIVALSDVRTFPWRVPPDEEDLFVVASGSSNSSSSTAAGSTCVNDDVTAEPAAEELVEMQRAQNAWVSESESQQQQQQYKSRADMHRGKVWQQLGGQQQDTGVWDSLTPGSSEPQQQNRGHRRYHHQTREPAQQHTASSISSSHDRRHEQQGGRTHGGGGHDSDTSSRYSTDTVRPGRSARHDDDWHGSGASPRPGPGIDAGSSRSCYRELTRVQPQPPPSPPPQPKSAFPATRRDWRPSGDGASRR